MLNILKIVFTFHTFFTWFRIMSEMTKISHIGKLEICMCDLMINILKSVGIFHTLSFPNRNLPDPWIRGIGLFLLI